MLRFTKSQFTIFGVLLITIVSISGYLLSKYTYDKGYNYGYQTGFDTFENNQIDLHNKRTQNEYVLNVNDEEFIQSVNLLEQGQTELFENQIFKIHEGIIEEMSNTFELNADERQNLRENLIASNPDITKEYIEEYLKSIKPLKSGLNENNTMVFSNTTRVEKATAAITSHICAFSTMIFSPLNMRTGVAQEYAAGYLLADPCSILISGFINPLSVRLVNAGIIKDFEINKIKVEQNYSKMIAELATAEVSFTTTKTLTKGSEWFFKLFKSSGTITYQFNAVVKAGFDLSENLEMVIDHQSKVVTINIASPKIFDPVISTQILEFDDQDMIKDLDINDLNAPLNAIKLESISKAEASDIKGKAIANAKLILTNLFQPIVGKGYELNINI